MKYLIPLLLLSGCAVRVPVSGHVDVNVNLSTQLQNYLQASCKNELGAFATTDQINACVGNKLADITKGIKV